MLKHVLLATVLLLCACVMLACGTVLALALFRRPPKRRSTPTDNKAQATGVDASGGAQAQAQALAQAQAKAKGNAVSVAQALAVRTVATEDATTHTSEVLFGAGVTRACSNVQYPQVPFDNRGQQVQAIAAPSGRARFVFIEPVRYGNNQVVQPATMARALCIVEMTYAALCRDFPELASNACQRLPNHGLLHVMVDANVREGRAVGSAAALGGFYQIVYAYGTINDTHGLLVPHITTHELGHVVFGRFYSMEPTWGQAIGETFGEFAAAWMYPTEVMGAYDSIPNYIGNVQNMHRNPYSLEALSYDDRGRAYNPLIWLFFVARYGRNRFAELLTKGHMRPGPGSKPLWHILAGFLGLDVRTLAAAWLGDLLTAAFLRDPERIAKARERLSTTHTGALVWKKFRNDALVADADKRGWACPSVDLEAFGLMVYDLARLVRDSALSGDVVVSVASDPPRPDDADAWVMVLVRGAGAGETSVAYGGETTLTSAVARGGTLVLGVMHTRMRLNSNAAAGTAVRHRIRIRAAAGA